MLIRRDIYAYICIPQTKSKKREVSHMKRFLSLLLVLTMVISMVGGGFTALADEAPAVVAEDLAVEAPVAEAPAAEAPAAEAPAEEAPAEEAPAEEAPAEEAPAEEAPAEEELPALLEGSPEEATSLTLSNTYVFVVDDGAGNKFALNYDSSAKKVVGLAYTDIELVPNSAQWIASCKDKGFALLNASDSTVHLYYNNTYTTTDAKANWSFSSNALYYTGSGQYYVTAVSADSITMAKGSSGLSVTAYQVAVGNGEASETAATSGGGGGSGSGSSSSSSVSYSKAKSWSDRSTYVAFVITDGDADTTFGTANGNFSVATATVSSNKLTVTTSNYLEVSTRTEEDGAAFNLFIQDPPGSYRYIIVDECSLTQSDKITDSSTPAGYWTYEKVSGNNTLVWHDKEGAWYISTADGSKVSFNGTEEGALKVSVYSGSSAPSKSSSSSSDDDEDAEAPTFVLQPGEDDSASKVAYTTDTAFATTQPVFKTTVQLPDTYTEETGATDITITPYLDGTAAEAVVVKAEDVQWVQLTEEIPATEESEAVPATYAYQASAEFAPTSLVNAAVGSYSIYFTAAVTVTTPAETEGGDPTTETHTATSSYAAYIVAAGVLENSAITFSDVHESWSSVGKAIGTVITQNEGKIPALIICTGDWSSTKGKGADEEETLSVIAKLKLQLADIDAVFSSGNHEDGATTIANADVGNYNATVAEGDTYGIIYDNRANNDLTDEAKEDDEAFGTSDALKTDVIVYSLTFDAVESSNDYADIITALEATLKQLVEEEFDGVFYIASHTGLHVLGIQPQSAAGGASEWAGSNTYNINNSYAMVTMLNKYAAQGLDIVFMFGHDHSKGESEIYLTPGNVIYSTINYDDQVYSKQTILFTYGHAGYLGGSGASTTSFSLFTFSDEKAATITREFYSKYTASEAMGFTVTNDFTLVNDEISNGWQIGSYRDTDGVLHENVYLFHWADGEKLSGIQKLGDGEIRYFADYEGKNVESSYNEENQTYYYAAHTYEDMLFYGGGTKGWVTIAEGDTAGTYYFLESGLAALGWWPGAGNTVYFFDTYTGIKQSGWICVDEYGNTDLTEEGDWYYLENDQIVTGWKKINGDWYYFNAVGVKQTGKQTIDGYIYYLGTDGKLQTGFVTLTEDSGKNTYLFATEVIGTALLGAARTGWVTDYTTDAFTGTYYFDKDGVMATGITVLEGKTYYFNDTSASPELGAKTALDGEWVQVDDNGSTSAEGENFYYFEDGAVVTGWKLFRVAEEELSYTEWCWFDATGKQATGLAEVDDAIYYFAGANVRGLVTGWVTLTEGEGDDAVTNNYYFNTNCKTPDDNLTENPGVSKLGQAFTGWHTGADDWMLYNTSSTGYAFSYSYSFGSSYSSYENENAQYHYYYFYEDGTQAVGWTDDITEDMYAAKIDSTTYFFGNESVQYGYGIEAGGWINYLWVGQVYVTDAPSAFASDAEDYQGNALGKYYYLSPFASDLGQLTTGVVAVSLNGSINEYGTISGQYNWRLVDETGSFLNGWITIDHGDDYLWPGVNYIWSAGNAMAYNPNYSGTYYGYSAGTLSTGWVKMDGSWYWFDTYGKRAEAKEAVIGMNTVGETQVPETAVLPGIVYVGGAFYAFNEDGVMQTGWIKIELGDTNLWLYATSSGALKLNQWFKSGGKWYYLGAGMADALATSEDADSLSADLETLINAYPYALNTVGYAFNSGVMCADGIYEINGVNYCFNASGAMATGWAKTSDGSWVYAASSGALYQEQWVKSGGKWYYLKANCLMADDEIITWNGSYYYLKSGGAMATGWASTTVVDGEGNESTVWVYANSSGALKTSSWVKASGGWCYLGADGIMAADGMYEIVYAGENCLFYFDASGYMAANTEITIGEGEDAVTYVANASGVCTVKQVEPPAGGEGGEPTGGEGGEPTGGEGEG